MRKLALPIALCSFAGYGCAASEESVPAGAGNSTSTPQAGASGNVGGSSAGGTALPIAGTSPLGVGGNVTAMGGAPAAGTAGTATAGSAGTTTGAAGTTGAGGAPAAGGTCVMKATSMGMPLLIDDLEDGNADITAVDGRVGGWYLSTDGTGTSTPAAGAPKPEVGGMPGKAIHVAGTGLKSWGASLSAALADNKTGCYDASKFTGISLSLKGTGMVYVSVLTAAVRDAKEGERNHYKKAITLTSDWTTVSISFSELTQPGGWGLMVPFDASKIYGIDIGPVQATAPATTDYDYWVDNLSFK